MFIFNNISSTDMEVIIEEEEHFLGKASQRYVRTEIEGKNGALFEEQGYTVIERPMKVQILNLDKLDKILGWLNGVGILEYKGRITKARFYNEIDPVRTANIKIADVTFIRDPFWNKKRDNYVTVQNMVTNEGNIYSEPIIRLEKNTSDKVDITINDIRFVYNFNNEEFVEIDCENQTVEYNKLNRNRQIEIGYKFPTLKPGENTVTIHSGDVLIKVKRKDRWL
ncbi:MAG: hypothetical protein HFJ60_07880 [Clostridia bacterium]|jgi:phage-related protein|nr:hypothetical protein [Clostridia bacterium]